MPNNESGRSTRPDGNGFTIRDLRVTTANAPAATDYGISTYGIHLSNCSNYLLEDVEVQPGNASNGLSGVAGADGLSGTNGAPGQNPPGLSQGNGGNGADGVSLPGSGGTGGVGGGVAGGNGGDALSGEIIDFAQQQNDGNIYSGDNWQSFTIVNTGWLTRIQAFHYAGPESGTLEIYEGEGTSGSSSTASLTMLMVRPITTSP